MKQLPNNKQLECDVLGACILEKHAYPRVSDILKEETFHDSANKHIFKAVNKLYSTDTPIDTITVIEKLKSSKKINEAGGLSNVVALTNRVTQSENIVYWSRLLKQLEIRRKLITVTKDIAVKAYDDSNDAFELLNDLNKELNNFATNSGNPVFKIDQVCDIVQKELFDPSLEDIGKVMPTGFNLLDEYLGGGIKQARYVLLGGRPGMGKTSFVLQLMLNMARMDIPIMFFSRETDKESILKRLICNIAGIEEYRMNPVSLEDFKKGVKTRLTTTEVSLVAGALDELKKLPIHINDTTGMSVGDCVNITKKMIFQHNIKMVVGDYIQLLNGDKSKGRTEEMSETSRILKAVSQNTKVTVLELAQLSRKVEDRGGEKRPMLSDLRETGQLEQDGQIIIFLYRPEYYGINEDEHGLSTGGLMEGIIAKNKDGKTETIPFKFTGKYFRVENYPSEYQRATYNK